MTPGDISGAIVLLAYYLVAAALLPTLLKVWTNTPLELVRKLHHIAYSLSIFLLLGLFSTWCVAVAAAFLLVVLAYPVLLVVEKRPRYRELFAIDRASRGGELRRQLLYVQLSFAILIAFFWGLLGDSWRFVVPVAVMAWGFGDAAAALVGKAFGRRRVLHRLVDGAKTYEGTGAMAVAAGLALFLTLLLYAGKPAPVSLAIALIAAPVCAIVELLSHRGIDTLTVPLSTAGIVLAVLRLFSLAGWA
jgi:phytol kinase